LLVVVAIIAILAGLMLPGLLRAKAQAYEVTCRSNMHQVHVVLDAYADDNDAWFPLEPTEMNPHPGLLAQLQANDGGLMSALYCPQAEYLEPAAMDTVAFPPMGHSTSIIDTPGNRAVGNISYFYWSMADRSVWRATNHSKYGEPMDSFRPRWLRNSGLPEPMPPSDPLTPCALQDYRPGDYWVLSDFFRMRAPFPHTRKHKNGLNVLCLDGHAEWMFGQPRANFK